MIKKILFIAIALLIVINPAAHAAGYGCDDLGAAQTELSVKNTSGDNQDENKLAGAAHHCVCGHASTQPIEYNAPLLGTLAVARNLLDDEGNPVSVVVGPPLQPPSRA